MQQVRTFVEARHIPYVRVDWRAFSDSDYFDYNHLNSQGIGKFTPQFAAHVKPYLEQIQDRSAP